uniref:Uncharacterized protein n=1 Tax=Panagrolaimus sp. JU765 TaxID=591449 RepID=A0AC34RG45_9BILA
MGKFDEKVVIVTGSSAGISQAVILAFAKEGASVVLHGTNGARIEETRKLLEQLGVSEAKLLIVRGDISDENVQDRLIEETVEKFGRIDVLINNAGLGKKDGVDYHSMDNFDYVMGVNLRAPFRLTQLALPYLEKTKGNIINTSSIVSIARTIDHPMMTVYGMSKVALDTFTKYECARLAKKGVRINNINPGAFATNIGNRGDPMFTPEQMAKVMEDGGKAMLSTIPVEHPMMTVYGMSKAALDTFTKYECARLAKKGVRINNINPGAFATNIGNRGDPMFTPEQMAKVMEDGGKAMLSTIPVGRIGLPSEIAPIYLQLADNEASSFITGVCWIIDGGGTCNAPKII